MVNWIMVNWIMVNWIMVNWIMVNWIMVNWIMVHWIMVNWIMVNFPHLKGVTIEIVYFEFSFVKIPSITPPLYIIIYFDITQHVSASLPSSGTSKYKKYCKQR
jgi:hypothetical protein